MLLPIVIIMDSKSSESRIGGVQWRHNYVSAKPLTVVIVMKLNSFYKNTSSKRPNLQAVPVFSLFSPQHLTHQSQIASPTPRVVHQKQSGAISLKRWLASNPVLYELPHWRLRQSRFRKQRKKQQSWSKDEMSDWMMILGVSWTVGPLGASENTTQVGELSFCDVISYLRTKEKIVGHKWILWVWTPLYFFRFFLRPRFFLCSFPCPLSSRAALPWPIISSKAPKLRNFSVPNVDFVIINMTMYLFKGLHVDARDAKRANEVH